MGQNFTFYRNITPQTAMFALIIVCALIVVPAIAVPTTQAATGVTGNTITFNGLSDIAGTYWFEYSPVSGGYTMSTPEQTIAAPGAAVSATVEGIPIIPGNTYYFRLSRTGSNGAELSATTPVIGVLPTTTYTEAYFDPFVAAKWNMSVMAPIVTGTYFTQFGYLIWAIFWGAILMAFWVRQEDVTLPAFVYLIIFTVLSLENYLPSTFVVVSYVFAGICLGAILYTLFRGRKHG